MLKNMLCRVMIWTVVVTMVVVASPVNQAFAQGERSIVPALRDITVELIDPATRMPKTSFCIGANMIDVKLTNNSNYRKYVTVVNRDTRGIERSLYRGEIEPGTSYLSVLMRTQLEVTGPAGTELLRVDINEYGQTIPGNWVSFYV